MPSWHCAWAPPARCPAGWTVQPQSPSFTTCFLAAGPADDGGPVPACLPAQAPAEGHAVSRQGAKLALPPLLSRFISQAAHSREHGSPPGLPCLLAPRPAGLPWRSATPLRNRCPWRRRPMSFIRRWAPATIKSRRLPISGDCPAQPLVRAPWPDSCAGACTAMPRQLSLLRCPMVQARSAGYSDADFSAVMEAVARRG